MRILPKMKLKKFENGLRDFSEEEEIVGARLVRGRRQRVAVEDNAVHLNHDIVDLRDERVEAVRNNVALTQGLALPILLKIKRRTESRRRPKWSMWDCGSENITDIFLVGR